MGHYAENLRAVGFSLYGGADGVGCAGAVGGGDVVSSVPVPQPVVDDPGGDGFVVAFAQVVEDFLVEGGVTA
jgi:hypothetical protein